MKLMAPLALAALRKAFAYWRHTRKRHAAAR